MHACAGTLLPLKLVICAVPLRWMSAYLWAPYHWSLTITALGFRYPYLWILFLCVFPTRMRRRCENPCICIRPLAYTHTRADSRDRSPHNIPVVIGPGGACEEVVLAARTRSVQLLSGRREPSPRHASTAAVGQRARPRHQQQCNPTSDARGGGTLL